MHTEHNDNRKHSLPPVLDISYNSLATLDVGTLASMRQLRWLGADGNDFGATLLPDGGHAEPLASLPTVQVRC
jgi:hypothetical protein